MVVHQVFHHQVPVLHCVRALDVVHVDKNKEMMFFYFLFEEVSATPDKGPGALSLVHPQRSSRKAACGQLEAGVAGGSRIWLLGH